MKRFLLLFSVGLVGEEIAKGEPRPRSLSSFSWCIFNASLVLVDGRKKKSSHQLFRVALKRRGCGIQCQSWEPEAFKPAKINFIYIHVSLPSYHSLSPTETDVLLGGYGMLWKKPMIQHTVTPVCTVVALKHVIISADYQITWKVFRTTVNVYLFTAADNQIILSILGTKQSFMMLCIIWYIWQHMVHYITFHNGICNCHSRAYKHIYLKRPNDIMWWKTSAHLLHQQTSVPFSRWALKVTREGTDTIIYLFQYLRSLYWHFCVYSYYFLQFS